MVTAHNHAADGTLQWHVAAFNNILFPLFDTFQWLSFQLANQNANQNRKRLSFQA